MTLEDRIKQTKALSKEARTDINLMLASSDSELLKRRILKPFRISWQQFNILRILKGQKENPVPLWQLTERMIDKTSNTSRLVDKLEKSGLVSRKLCPQDRRRVEITILPEGLELLEHTSAAMAKGLKAAYKGLTQEEFTRLNTLLDKVRKVLLDNQ